MSSDASEVFLTDGNELSVSSKHLFSLMLLILI